MYIYIYICMYVCIYIYIYNALLSKCLQKRLTVPVRTVRCFIILTKWILLANSITISKHQFSCKYVSRILEFARYSGVYSVSTVQFRVVHPCCPRPVWGIFTYSLSPDITRRITGRSVVSYRSCIHSNAVAWSVHWKVKQSLYRPWGFHISR